jgi:hypothetical protein
MLKRPFSPSGADCAATGLPLIAIAAAKAAAASQDVVDDVTGLIALSATTCWWLSAKFYTPV